MRKSFFWLALVFLSGLSLQSCVSNQLETLEEGNLCFEKEILPIFVSNCASPGCHNAEDRRDGRNYTDYDGIIKDIRKGKPEKSRIIRVMKDFTNERMPPPPRQPVSDEQIAAVEAWINTGAFKSSGCETVTCDTVANVSFSAEVSPILKLRCEGCHTASAPSGNIELDVFEAIQGVAQSGSMLGSINGDDAYVQMPWNSDPLSECEIKTIRVWIEEGAQDN